MAGMEPLIGLSSVMISVKAAVGGKEVRRWINLRLQGDELKNEQLKKNKSFLTFSLASFIFQNLVKSGAKDKAHILKHSLMRNKLRDTSVKALRGHTIKRILFFRH